MSGHVKDDEEDTIPKQSIIQEQTYSVTEEADKELSSRVSSINDVTHVKQNPLCKSNK